MSNPTADFNAADYNACIIVSEDRGYYEIVGTPRPWHAFRAHITNDYGEIVVIERLIGWGPWRWVVRVEDTGRDDGYYFVG